MIFRWTQRRDRELQTLLADHYRYREIAAIMGCSENDARTRAKLLRGWSKVARGEDPSIQVAPPSGEIIRAGLDGARGEVSRPQPALEASPHPRGKIQLPRYGEMERRYDPVTRARLAGDE